MMTAANPRPSPGPSPDASFTKEQRRAIFKTLLTQARSNAPLAQRWLLLEAAHVVGQTDLRLHYGSHAAMLGLAWRTWDVEEVAGQVFRIALVPLGHLLNRLPAGNTGRSDVSAFRPMHVPQELEALILAAQISNAELTATRPPKP